MALRNDTNSMISPYVLPGLPLGYGATCAHIAVKVAEYHEMDIEQLKKHNRQKKFVEPRQIAMCIMISKGVTLKDISRYFDLDHTTVMSARKRIGDLIDTEPVFKDRYNKVKEYALFD